MPEMDGFEVLARILLLDPDANVIVVTADTQAVVRRRCLSEGAKDVINKPIPTEKLAELIEAYR